MKSIDISKRMKAVADMTVAGHTVADIGCDHAFVPIYLIKNNISKMVIASDVRSGPCDIAKKNIAAFEMEDYIDLRLGNGLETVRPGEADTIIIAGMGGMLINTILNNGLRVAASAKQLILQPQSDIDKVRANVLANGWNIVSEKMLVDMGKYYTILNVSTSDNEKCLKKDNTEAEYADIAKYALEQAYSKYGRYLIEQSDPVLKEYLLEKREKNEMLLAKLHNTKTEKSMKRYDDLVTEQEVINVALRLLEK
ncbi:MAG: tRNA (adenine(22)-N(1))-methyltransferase [Coprococcus sp.]